MTSKPDGPDLKRLTDAFALHDVEYLLVGGIASRAYGARRPTFDVDCLPEPSRENLDRLATAMRDLHSRLRVEGLTDEEAAQLPVQVTGSTLIRLEISTWRTDAGDLDILAAIPDRYGRHMRYAELVDRASMLDLEGIVVRVAALDDVIASREWGQPAEGPGRPTRAPIPPTEVGRPPVSAVAASAHRRSDGSCSAALILSIPCQSTGWYRAVSAGTRRTPHPT